MIYLFIIIACLAFWTWFIVVMTEKRRESKRKAKLMKEIDDEIDRLLALDDHELRLSGDI